MALDRGQHPRFLIDIQPEEPFDGYLHLSFRRSTVRLTQSTWYGSRNIKAESSISFQLKFIRSQRL